MIMMLRTVDTHLLVVCAVQRTQDVESRVQQGENLAA